MPCPKKYKITTEVIRNFLHYGKTGFTNSITDFFPDCNNLLNRLDLLKNEGCIEDLERFLFIIKFEEQNTFKCRNNYHFKYNFTKLAAELHIYLKYKNRYLSNKNDYEIFNQALNKSKELKMLDDGIYNELHNQLEQNEIKNIHASFHKIAYDIMNPDVHDSIVPPLINDNDIELVKKWLNIKNNINLSNILLYEKKMDWELRRLISARIAEKGAKLFYENYGCNVEDVSITQITINNSTDWKICDLKVYSPFTNYNISIDIKNSRRAQNSKERYVDYCIPNFKLDRHDRNVIIAGVLSNYLSLKELVYNKYDIIFLGETTIDRQKMIKEEFEDNLLKIYIGNPGYYFLPPWMFDYPSFVYDNRERTINIFKSYDYLERYLMLYRNINKQPINIKPICIAAGIDITQITDYHLFKDDPGWMRDLYTELLNNRQKFKKYGLDLPIVFYTLLKHFLRVISDPQKKYYGFRPIRYQELLIYRNSMPIGIYDPLNTIKGLIKALDILWVSNHDLIRKFKIFKLVSYNILKGSFNKDGKWSNLIAYCGGHLSDGSACGKNPLILGDKVGGKWTVLCEKCGYLICPICSYCNCKKIKV